MNTLASFKEQEHPNSVLETLMRPTESVFPCGVPFHQDSEWVEKTD